MAKERDSIWTERDTQKQNEGYDEAARGGKGMPPTDVGVPLTPDERPAATSSIARRARQRTTCGGGTTRRSRARESN